MQRHYPRFLAVLALSWWVLASAQVQEAPPAPRFDIQRFVVEGNTLLPARDVERIVAPFTGKSRDFGDVQRALEALEAAYVARGYSAVRVSIPEQDLVAGEVRLRVVEARLRNLRVEGNQFFNDENVRASLPRLKPGEPPNTKLIGENVQLVNENPVKQTRVVFEAADEPGKVDAVARVTDDKPARVNMFLDNTGTSQTGFYRAGIGYQNANLWNRDGVLTMQFITSPDQVDNVRVWGFGYHVPLYARNSSVDVFAGHSSVNAGTIQNLFSVAGAGTILGARWNLVLPHFGALEHKVIFGYDYRSFANNVLLLGTNGTLVPDLNIQPFSVGYNGRLSQVGRDIAFYGTLSWNVPAGSDGDQNAFNATRLGASSHYVIWRFGGSYSQVLGKDYLLRASLIGQYSRNLLVPGEQFGMGGVDSVRGFFEREVVNDIGHRASIELYGRDFGEKFGADWRARPVAFVDWARGSDNSPARNPANIDNGLSSIGIGARLNRGKSLSLRLDWAVAVNGTNVPGANGGRPAGKDRLHFALTYAF